MILVYMVVLVGDYRKLFLYGKVFMKILKDYFFIYRFWEGFSDVFVLLIFGKI